MRFEVACELQQKKSCKTIVLAVVVLVDRVVMTDTFMRQTYHDDEMLCIISEAAALS